MFKLFKLNGEVLPFPSGVKPVDMTVGSIAKERNTQTIEGVPGVIDYGYRLTTRPIELKFYLRADNPIDFRRVRQAIFNLLTEPFYVVEDYLPDRRFTVIVPTSFSPKRYERNTVAGEFEVTVEPVDLPFSESVEVIEQTGLTINVSGDRKIEPFHQFLQIELTNVQNSTEFIQLKNTANGSAVKITEAVSAETTVFIDKAMVKINGTQAFRRTTHTFITLEPGMNVLELTGATSADVLIKYRNYYE